MHREGLLAHTTLHSIGQCKAYAEAMGMRVELIITLDNANSLTEKIVRNHPVLSPQDKIESTDYGDAGLARNHGIASAAGEYIVIMDGDDYYSQNFLAIMVQEVAQRPDCAAFPEYIFTFDGQYNYIRLDSHNKNDQTYHYALFSSNLYCSRVAAHKELFIHIPYSACKPGFGFEDWHWACEALSNGVELRIAPNTVLFYRRRPGSRCDAHVRNAAIIPPSHFFVTFPKPAVKVEQRPPSRTQIPCAQIYWKPLIKNLAFAALRRLPTSLGNWLYTALRQWRQANTTRRNIFAPVIHNALLDVARIDGQLHPDYLPHVSRIMPTYDDAPGRAYAAAWHALPEHKYDIIYITPRINIGGAETS